MFVEFGAYFGAREPDKKIAGREVRALVRPEKMKLAWMFRQKFMSGVSSSYIFHSDASTRVTRWQLIRPTITTLLLFLIESLRGLLIRDRTRYPYIQNYLYEEAFRHIKVLGKLYGQYVLITQPVDRPVI